jgi:isoleucyl-tRNA synthetase
VAGINPLTEQEIWNEYAQARPRPGVEYKQWVALTAEKYQVLPKEVVRTVGAEISSRKMAVQQANYTEAQHVAQAMGVTMALAIERLGQQLNAKKVVRHFDKDGELVYEATDIDNSARNFAIRSAFAMWGANAPQTFHVEHDVGENLSALGEAAIKVRMLEVAAKIKKLAGEGGVVDVSPANVKSANGSNTPPQRVRTVRAGTANPPSGDGLLLLADGTDTD